MANCKDCSNCITKNSRVNCDRGFWNKEYTFDSVVRSRVPEFFKLPERCSFYSPPEKPPTPFIPNKSELNRTKIARIVEALRDGRKHWYYDERPFIKDAFWEEYDR
jgi:hypothetical protein